MTEQRSLTERLAALSEAVDLGRGRASAEVLGGAEEVIARAGRRLALSGDHTVVALAGATGSGKSTLFNALSKSMLAQTGVRRPTTSTAMAVGWGTELPHDLLDWLDVSRRHLIASGASENANLVLLDLPDHDSTELDHRLAVDRLVPLVDMLVWVVDPQKYADAVLHDRYLRPLAPFAENMVVVLNQIDRLANDEAQRCQADLRKLLDGEGLARTPIVALSAVEGTNVGVLRSLLIKAVQDKAMAVRRISTDLEQAASALAADVGTARAVQIDPGPREALVDALADLAGVGLVADGVTDSWRRRGKLATGWPVIAWVARLRPDPLKRLRLAKPPAELSAGNVARTSIPAPTVAQRARVETAMREVVSATAAHLPRGWADAVRKAARGNEPLLRDRLDAVIGKADLHVGGRRVWWTVVAILQWLLLITALAGVVWWFAAPALAVAGLPQLPSLTWQSIPVPFVLISCGVTGGLVLAGLSRIFVEVGARLRGRRVRRELREAIAALTQTEILDEVQAELDRHAKAVAAVERAR